MGCSFVDNFSRSLSFKVAKGEGLDDECTHNGGFDVGDAEQSKPRRTPFRRRNRWDGGRDPPIPPGAALSSVELSIPNPGSGYSVIQSINVTLTRLGLCSLLRLGQVMT